MCYYVEVRYNNKKYKLRFRTRDEIEAYFANGEANGFSHPYLPTVYNDHRDTIEAGKWGLVPFWAKDGAIAKNTLNAKIETITEKPSFRNYAKNRCLVAVDAFFEWKWLDEKGKQKQKYRIRQPGDEPFALAGIWAEKDGERTISIVTTEANTLMAEIHNTKKRMPVVLHREEEDYWLQGGDFGDFMNRSETELIAEPVDKENTLF